MDKETMILQNKKAILAMGVIFLFIVAGVGYYFGVTSQKKGDVKSVKDERTVSPTPAPKVQEQAVTPTATNEAQITNTPAPQPTAIVTPTIITPTPTIKVNPSMVLKNPNLNLKPVSTPTPTPKYILKITPHVPLQP